MTHNKTSIDYWNDGMAAAEQGLSLGSCHLLFDAWPRQAWFEGWYFYHSYKHCRCKPEPTLNDRVPKSATQQGTEAYKRGIKLDDCPYGPNTKLAEEWETGWLIEEQEHTKVSNFGLAMKIYFSIALLVAIVIFVYINS